MRREEEESRGSDFGPPATAERLVKKIVEGAIQSKCRRRDECPRRFRRGYIEENRRRWREAVSAISANSISASSRDSQHRRVTVSEVSGIVEGIAWRAFQQHGIGHEDCGDASRFTDLWVSWRTGRAGRGSWSTQRS